MKTAPECLACFVRQAVEGMRVAAGDTALQEQAELRVHALLEKHDRADPPPLMGRAIHHLIAAAAGTPDPYRELKDRSTRFALELLPELESLVRESDDPFGTAVRLAIAGNIIDFGAGMTVDDELVRSTIRDALVQPLDRQALEGLRAAAARAESILYLGDNAGEAVFDRLLIGELPRGRVTFAVRGGPVINDCTREDAAAAGIEELVPVMDTGADIPGIVLDRCSDSFRQAFRGADLIIAKGQGNYETLGGSAGNIYFLFKVKCAPVARSCGRPPGSAVILPGAQAV